MTKIIVGILALVIIGIVAFYLVGNPTQKEEKAATAIQNEMTQENMDSPYKVTPISHASFILNLSNQIIFNDPVGGAELYEGMGNPDIILLSDIHADHFDLPTLKAISKPDTIIVAPKAVADKFSEELLGTIVVLPNGEKTTQGGIVIEAIPMYNVPESPTSPHTKGRGNGYVLEAAGKRIYIAGDTADTSEMKALQNIDLAFIPMNLPYTMSVETAANAVIAFKPKAVTPYHYRGPDGLSDISKFRDLVEKVDSNIKVDLLDFYPTGAGS